MSADVVPPPRSDVWYAANAVELYRRLGWRGDASAFSVKLVHPLGRARFDTDGVVFIDGPYDATDDTRYARLCVLFPGQRMALHHHERRVEVFKVIAGTMLALGDVSHRVTRVPVGAYLRPAIGERHGVATDATGCAYVGVCHVEHATDVHWEQPSAASSDALAEAGARVTVINAWKAVVAGHPVHLPDALASFEATASIEAHLAETCAYDAQLNRA